jgi:TfoX/Sxy family transcriptional regulator of competence genes
MAYDEDLADRARAVMPADADVTERKMFGGIAFLLSGHMFAGVVGSELMVRLGSESAEQALELAHVREMDFTGRPMKNMVFVQPAGLGGPELEHWVTAAADYARTLPPKQPKRPGHRAGR